MSILGADAAACSTTAIIRRCVHAAPTADLLDELATRGMEFEPRLDDEVTVKTKHLIDELRRRGRLAVIDYKTTFHGEMEGDDGYMRHIEHYAAHGLARTLTDKGFVYIQDSPPNPYSRSMEKIRRASIVVLLNQEQADKAEKDQADQMKALAAQQAD